MLVFGDQVRVVEPRTAARELEARLQAIDGMPIITPRMTWSAARPCYLAFQLGRHALAVTTGDGPRARRRSRWSTA